MTEECEDCGQAGAAGEQGFVGVKSEVEAVSRGVEIDATVGEGSSIEKA